MLTRGGLCKGNAPHRSPHVRHHDIRSGTRTEQNARGERSVRLQPRPKVVHPCLTRATMQRACSPLVELVLFHSVATSRRFARRQSQLCLPYPPSPQARRTTSPWSWHGLSAERHAFVAGIVTFRGRLFPERVPHSVPDQTGRGQSRGGQSIFEKRASCVQSGAFPHSSEAMSDKVVLFQLIFSSALAIVCFRLCFVAYDHIALQLSCHPCFHNHVLLFISLSISAPLLFVGLSAASRQPRFQTTKHLFVSSRFTSLCFFSLTMRCSFILLNLRQPIARNGFCSLSSTWARAIFSSFLF